MDGVPETSQSSIYSDDNIIMYISLTNKYGDKISINRGMTNIVH